MSKLRGKLKQRKRKIDEPKRYASRKPKRRSSLYQPSLGELMELMSSKPFVL